MSLACVVLVAMFGQMADAEDLVLQMQAQDEQIRTLEFLFDLEQVRGPGYFNDDNKVERTQFRGRLRYRAPHEVKLERLSESGDVVEARAISPNGDQVKNVTVLPNSGTVGGVVSSADSKFYLSTFHGISWLFRHPLFDDLLILIRSAKEANKPWQVVSAGKLLRLSATHSDYEYTRDVDPAHGYWIVSGKLTRPRLNLVRTEVAEPVEISPGIWIAKRAGYEQTRNGKISLTVSVTTVMDSVRLNQPFDAKAFAVDFPSGAVVDNLLTNTTEFVGGRNSRDRASVEKLAAAGNVPTPIAPSKEEDRVPLPNALRVPETSLWNSGSFIIIAVLSLLVIVGGWFSWQRWGRS